MTLYHHSRRVCLLIPAIAVLIGQAAASKDASPETTPSFLSHEIVVTAARLETPLIEIASAVPNESVRAMPGAPRGRYNSAPQSV